MSGNDVAILGRTTGSNVSSELEEKETVLWTAKIQDGFIAEWRLYSNIKEIRRRKKG